jgi:glycosyltransferase involved in cell wall biosynthesis
VTVCIPFFQCHRFLRRAVNSILKQSHRDLTLVVVNDADPDPPWPLLADVSDPRLVRFDLVANHGRYFADAVVVRATDSEYYMTQDADDWSTPDRLETLLRALRSGHADVAVSSIQKFELRGSVVAPLEVQDFGALLGKPLDEQFTYRVPHYALFRVEALRAIGGYYGGHRMEYDRLLMNLLLMTARLVYVNRPLYGRMLRPGSLFTSPDTGERSPERQRIRAELTSTYRQALSLRRRYVSGEFDANALREAIARLCTARLDERQRDSLESEAARLRSLLARAPTQN